jgi:hypothetical protein
MLTLIQKHTIANISLGRTLSDIDFRRKGFGDRAKSQRAYLDEMVQRFWLLKATIIRSDTNTTIH